MTRAGEKLYGDWDAPVRGEGLFASRRFWRGVVDMLLSAMTSLALFRVRLTQGARTGAPGERHRSFVRSL